jgi:hypothetical protein
MRRHIIGEARPPGEWRLVVEVTHQPQDELSAPPVAQHLGSVGTDDTQNTMGKVD